MPKITNIHVKEIKLKSEYKKFNVRKYFNLI